MFESNFPVDKGSCSYAALWNAFKRIAAGCFAAENRRCSPIRRPNSTGSDKYSVMWCRIQSRRYIANIYSTGFRCRKHFCQFCKCRGFMMSGERLGKTERSPAPLKDG